MFVDLVFLGDICNLECTYCSAGSTEWKRIGDTIAARRTDGASFGLDLPALRARLFSIVDACAAQGVRGLKLSGGEIFTHPELAAAVIDRACRTIDAVQVLTNGLRIDELQALLATHDNLFVQLSIDGFTPGSNAARTTNPAHTHRIVEHARVLGASHPLELNVVLTKWNARALPETLDAARTLGDDVIVYPFPVRTSAIPATRSAETPGPFLPGETEQGRLEPSLADLAGLDRVIEHHDRWADVLPPQGYMEALRAFYRTRNVRGDCRIPRAITGLDQNGVQAVCPCGDLGRLGTIGEGLRDVGSGPIHGEACRGCFTHYEIVHHVRQASEARGPFTRRLVEDVQRRADADTGGRREAG